MALQPDNTPTKIEDMVRDLPANQGKNDNAMWLLVDAAIAAAQTATTLNPTHTYVPANMHGRK